MEDWTNDALKFSLTVVLALLVLISIGMFQPTHEENCQNTKVLGLEVNDNGEDKSTYTIAMQATSDEALVIIVEAETFYTLSLGDSVEACEIRGDWFGTLESYKIVRLAQ